MKFFLLASIMLATHSIAFANVTKIFNVAPFAVQDNGEVIYSQDGNIILESNVLTKKERSFNCDLNLGTATNERLNVHHLDSKKMIIIKETLDVDGWQKDAWVINLQIGNCQTVSINEIGQRTYKAHFTFSQKVNLPSKNLMVKASLMYNQGGSECYGVRTVDLLTNKESGFKWDKFCGPLYGVNLLAIQNNSNVALLHKTGEQRYDFYAGVDDVKSDQAFKMTDSVYTDSDSLYFMNLKNHPSKILLFTFRDLGEFYRNNDSGVYILDL